jgi:periplasmic protein TonB
MVTHLDSSFLRFFALSLALHLVLLLLWPKSSINRPASIPIPVALLPPPEKLPEKPAVTPQPPAKKIPRGMPKEAPTRISQAPAIIAKKNSPILEDKPIAPQEKSAPKETKRQEPAAQKEFEENPVIAERSLPTVKDLLPRLGGPSGERSSKGSERPIPLNTSDPQYRTYLVDVERIIDANWQYPELAIQYGLQGTVVIEFMILENGRVEDLRLVRSSGSRLLDEEVFRAILASSPFRRLPSWIEPKRLWISATMEYRDGRFKAWLGR